MGTLTVRENLMFSASLRLPSNFGKHDRLQRVEMIINDLGLNKVADSKVDGQFILCCIVIIISRNIETLDGS